MNAAVQPLQSSVNESSARPTILLTGATGRLGQLVAMNLNAQHIAWRGFARRPDAALALGAKEVVSGEFNQTEKLAEAMKGVEQVILISGDDPQQEQLEINVVNAAKQAGVKGIVKLSAQSAGLTPPVSFGRKHIQVEEAIRASGLAWAFIRPVFFQQSFLMFADPIRKSNKIILPAGKGSVAFVNAQDVAECLVKALDPSNKGKVFTLTGARSLSFSQAGQIIGSARGKAVGYVAPPAWIARIVLPKASGMPRWLAMEVIDLLQAISKNAQANVTNDVQRLLGKAPRTFESFAGENVKAFSAP
jgi:uncharacterized protein YbjT (DUF2867 family)